MQSHGVSVTRCAGRSRSVALLVMGDLTNGAFALLGTALGAGITQIAPVVASISGARRRRAEDARRRAQAKADVRRPLYNGLDSRDQCGDPPP